MQLQTPTTFGVDVGTVTPVVTPTAASLTVNFEVLGALLTALCARDRLTAEHSWRVARYCIRGVECHYGFVDQLHVGVAALLHDVGKIGIPDWVLKKPAALNPYETTVMRMHDAIGVEILRAARMHEDVIAIIQQHTTSLGTAMEYQSHQDSARILRIVDAYDSLVSDDVYRLGKSAAEALQEVYRCAGSQFDPAWLDRLTPTLEQCERKVEKPTNTSRASVTRVVEYLAPLSLALDQEDIEGVRRIAAEVGELTDNRALYALTKDFAQGEIEDATYGELWLALWNEQLAYLV